MNRVGYSYPEARIFNIREVHDFTVTDNKGNSVSLKEYEEKLKPINNSLR